MLRPALRRTALALPATLLLASTAHAQDLVPAAYTPGPVGFNVITLVASFNRGDVTFDPSLPVEDGRARIRSAAVGFTRSFDLAGRYANVGVAVPYVHGHVEGLLLGQFQETTRSGLADMGARIAVNLYGARAMTLREFAAYRASTTSTIVGLSLGVGIPVGQYDPGKAINIGTHRWSFKSEIGVSRRRGRWTVEGDVGGVFFTANTNFLNGGTRTQAPILTFQGHLIYTVRPGMWAAFDGNFWRGGRVTTKGAVATELQNNSRLGLTLALPVGRQQLRVAFSEGAYTRLGGDFLSLGVSYSYAWTRRRP
jgi:hypothetical protein